MTIKLNQNQLEGLFILTEYLLNEHKYDNMGESLLYEIVFKIKEKIRSKLSRKQFDNRAGNSLSLTSIEAKAFYVWYNQNAIIATEENWTYERIVGTEVINQIDKTYA